MKIEQFNYFSPKTEASNSTQQMAAHAKAADFDIDFQPGVKNGHTPETPASGWTCTLVCHITQLICPTRNCS